MVREKKIYPFAEGLTTADTFVVLGDAEKFQKHKHAWKVWRALKEFGCVAYPVAVDLKRIDGSKVYRNLTELKDKVSVVVPCLPPEKLKSLVSDASSAGANRIWFQEQTWSQEFQQECDNAGMTVIRGCVLRHKIYPIFGMRFFNPCYWHGLRDVKVPAKQFIRF
ncbi:CoA-binding protein [Desulfosporosinus sp. Sb-LF]|uniref:CoA-binding protein n=1 Tax=Desulfosporosinus sp. Sb-LF TaxID=2560027 RepID=UPI00107F48AD|nr:CoA-binding protein [Desulfosporosinus sp. Sb-LF]TGE34268.1 CoA-binding protein [Desulfosporosinus sp. Sb-LF]